MKKVYCSHSLPDVGQLKAILEEHHVACVIRNESLAGGIGELPQTECWPELWIAEDALYAKACALVEAFAAPVDASGPDWTCVTCGECSGPAFTDCWQCGRPRDGA